MLLFEPFCAHGKKIITLIHPHRQSEASHIILIISDILITHRKVLSQKPSFLLEIVLSRFLSSFSSPSCSKQASAHFLRHLLALGCPNFDYYLDSEISISQGENGVLFLVRECGRKFQLTNTALLSSSILTHLKGSEIKNRSSFPCIMYF